jgi:hypothetical protein
MKKRIENMIFKYYIRLEFKKAWNEGNTLKYRVLNLQTNILDFIMGVLK